MTDQSPGAAPRFTPEILEDIADRLHDTDILGGDGIADALTWAAGEIRKLEAENEELATIAILRSDIAALRANIATLQPVMDDIALLVREANAAEKGEAWS